MRKFTSYGPIDTDLHYYAPRTHLIRQVVAKLAGEPFEQGGHFITIWAPRQGGKTWVMIQAQHQLRAEPFAEALDVVALSLDAFKTATQVETVIAFISQWIARTLAIEIPTVSSILEFQEIFSKRNLPKPLVLILDEFDSLQEHIISELIAAFRGIYLNRQYQTDRPTGQQEYLLHGVALIGVRSVLGAENPRGSPFNIQHNMHIPNLSYPEVVDMFQWYEKESNQLIEPAVIERLFAETQGQPGLTCWLGELLTETYNEQQPQITLADFERVFNAAVNRLPNVNILNLISKAKQEPYRQVVLELFRTRHKLPFRFDDPEINFLYLHGVVDETVAEDGQSYVKFANPLVQKRLFNYFAHELFGRLDQVSDPFDDLADTVTAAGLVLPNLLRRYESYLHQNRHWLFKDAPRRTTDLRIYEAVYHFNFYRYLSLLLESYQGQVYPEFPTGNGQIDLLIRFQQKLYGVEVKSFSNPQEYRHSLSQAARYGQQLGLTEIALVFFVEAIDDANRQKYGQPYPDAATGVMVLPLFVVVGTE